MDLISSFLKCSCWSGHDRTSAACLLYPKKRTLLRRDEHVRFVPEADITDDRHLLQIACVQ